MPSRKTSALGQYGESLLALEHHVARYQNAAPDVLQGANAFLEWMTSQVVQKKGLREAPVRKKAQSLLLPGAIEALSCIAAPKTIERIFKHSGTVYDFADDVERYVPKAKLHGAFVYEQVEATASLLSEIIDFCHCLVPVKRVSLAPGERTRNPSAGREYCKLCFRPSQRYLRLHSCTMTLQGTSLGRVIGNERAIHSGQPDITKWRAFSTKYCEDRHSLAGKHSVTGRKLRGKNRGPYSRDKKSAVVQQFEEVLTRRRYEAVLAEKCIENPWSRRLQRRVAFYHAKPRMRHELKRQLLEHQVHGEKSSEHFDALYKLLDYGLSAFFGFRFDDLSVGDDLLLVEMNPTGVIAVHADGTAVQVPLTPISDPSERRIQFEKASQRIEVLLNRHFEKRARSGVRRAYFETLGVEIFLERSERIRWVFDAPVWLSRACKIDLRKP